MIKLSLEQLRNCTCKKHYEERCKVGRHFNEPKHCIVCMDEELQSLREANKNINEKRLFLLKGLEVTWKIIDALPPDPAVDYTDYGAFKREFERKA